MPHRPHSHPECPDPRAAVLAAYARSVRSLAERLDGDIPLLRRCVPEETFEAEVLAGIERQARELAELAAGLWELAELEMAAGGPRDSSIDIRSLARRALRSSMDIARSRRILVYDRVPEGLPSARGAPDRIGRAMDAALAGLIRLSAEEAFLTLEAAAGEGAVTIALASDRAPELDGISLEDLPARLHAGPGPGATTVPVILSLAVARLLVIEAGGEMRLDGSRGEKGKTVRISIRLPVSPVTVLAGDVGSRP